jgi:outer membrane lipoprotein-sorting protein
MYKILIVSLTLLSLSTIVFASPVPTPEALAQSIYERNVGNDMQFLGTMKLISKSGHIRTRAFISYRKDKEGNRSQLIRFSEPADIEGTGFLSIENFGSNDTEQHLYLPALKRTRRIVASQKGRSFVNSDFTYEDMQRHPVSGWNYELAPEDTVLGILCYVLISTPHKNTDTQYSKVISWVDKNNYMPLRTIFWDKKNRQAKEYRVNQIEIFDGIPTETDVIMKDLLTGHQTQILSQQILYNSGLKESLFSARYLQKW